MKTNKRVQWYTVLFIMLGLVSCVQDDDFSIPDLDNEVLEIEGQLIPISSVAGQVGQAIADGDVVVTFEDTDAFIEGYVISSDEAGNFFEEIVIQDAPENPTVGIKISIDVNPLFTSYEFGRKVFIRLNGLTAGFANGVLTLGIRDGSNVGQIPGTLQDEIIVRSSEVTQIIPLPTLFSEFSTNKTNLFISLTDVQFNVSDVVVERKSYAAEPEDEFDGERVLEDCATGGRTIFSTSTFADFKGLLLPVGRGSINGILTRDFFGEVFNVVINDPSGMDFLSEERCDLCGLAEEIGNEDIFVDSLDNGSLSNGWTNFTQEGTESWEPFSAGGGFGTAARIGSFMSGDESTIAWLITPEIDFDAQEMETMNFETSNSFSDESELALLFSDDWDGNTDNIDDANWRPILEAVIVSDDTFFEDWIPSGNIDLSCLTGTVHIAFRYIGSGDEDFDGTYELDEIRINAQ